MRLTRAAQVQILRYPDTGSAYVQFESKGDLERALLKVDGVPPLLIILPLELN